MTAPDAPNGGPPSRNGTGPRDGTPAAEGARERVTGGSRREVVLRLSDRLDALERALGTVRRRGMKLQVISLSRRAGELELVFHGEPDQPVPDRWIAELDDLVDVRQVRVDEVSAS